MTIDVVCYCTKRPNKVHVVRVVCLGSKPFRRQCRARRGGREAKNQQIFYAVCSKSAPNVEFRNSKGKEMCQQAHGPYSRNAIVARGDTFELTRRYLLSFCPRPLWLAHLPQCSY